MIHEDKPSLDDALMHFGVKGMKWGQRKKKEFSTERRIIEKGHEFQNISAGKSVQIGDRRVFASHKVKDNLAYKSKYADVLKFVSDDAETYTNVLVASKNIKVASDKDAFDAFKKMYETDPVGMNKAIGESQEAFMRSIFNLGDTPNKKIADENVKSVAKKGEKWMLKQGYTTFTSAAGVDILSRDVADSYYGSLAKMGFDAVGDHVDKTAKLSEDPIIFLKPKNSIKLKETLPLSQADIDLAAKLYKQQKKLEKNEQKRLKAESKT